MPIFGEKPVTSITVKINQLSTPHRNEDIDDSIELYLSDLIHLIQLQTSTGAIEAARAIRKNIKYGDSVGQQLRALSVLELLVLNSGPKIGSIIAQDDKLLDVLKGIIDGHGKTSLGSPYDKQVQAKVRGLARGWRSELDGMNGFKYMATLWKNIPGSKNRESAGHSRSQSANVFDSADDNTNKYSPPSTPEVTKRTPPPRPTTASPYASTRNKSLTLTRFGESLSDSKNSKKKKRRRRGKNGVLYADQEYKIPQINYKVESPKIRATISDCVTHTTALNNALITMPNGLSPLDDEKANSEFEKCRSIRRKVLRYLQYVGAGDESTKSREVLAMDEEFLGSLIGANEQLVAVFKKFDEACGYTEDNPAPNYDDDVDSEGYESYYTDESSDENLNNDESATISNGLKSVYLDQEGSSSSIIAKKSPPPPRPAKPSALLQHTKPELSKVDTNDSVSSDPFGDGNETSNSRSKYY